MKIINEKLWNQINSINYNRAGNRYRFAAFDYSMCDSRIVLAVFDAGDEAENANVPERKMPCVDCLLWSANENDSDEYWASFISLLLALVEDNTAWVYHDHSLRSRAARGEEACLIYPDDRVYTHAPVDMDKLPESEWTAALTEWVREIRESDDTVCVYDECGNINHSVLTIATRRAIEAYEDASEIYLDYGEEFDDASRFTPECGHIYE